MNRKNKYIIWGAGFRGMKLFSLLKKARVAAFIDNDINIVGNKIYGVPVIDFQTYCDYYQTLFIIISVADYRDIELCLKNNNIYQYFILSECPSEFKGYGIHDLDRLLKFSFNKMEDNIIVGSNLFSCLLYEKMKIEGCPNLYCYPNEGRSNETIQKMEKLLDMNMVWELDKTFQKKGRAYITTREKNNIDAIQTSGLECINAQDFAYRIEEYYNPLLIKFKNRHLGERCFIVATGSSLRTGDINVLKQNREICFSMNRIFQIEGSSWLPDYYVAVDNMFLRKYKTNILNYPAKTKFVGNFEMDGKYDEKLYQIHCVTDDIFTEAPAFSEDITHVVYGGATVTYACIQIAAYMGFKDIFLIGVDCDYSKGSKNNYFFQEKTGDYINHETDRMILSYQSAKRYADSHGIKIYNATRGGKLEVFERVNFDILFENIE